MSFLLTLTIGMIPTTAAIPEEALTPEQIIANHSDCYGCTHFGELDFSGVAHEDNGMGDLKNLEDWQREQISECLEYVLMKAIIARGFDDPDITDECADSADECADSKIGCSPGQHINVQIVSVSSIIVHTGNEHPRMCNLHERTDWQCLACGAIGAEMGKFIWSVMCSG